MAALLASRLAASLGYKLLALKGDALLVVLAINSPSLFSSLNFFNCIADISLVLSFFRSWNILKVSHSVNFQAQALRKLAASYIVFGSNPIGYLILSSI